MIANVSPSSKSYDDTQNTLKYANRAKEIKSSVSISFLISIYYYSSFFFFKNMYTFMISFKHLHFFSVSFPAEE